MSSQNESSEPTAAAHGGSGPGPDHESMQEPQVASAGGLSVPTKDPSTVTRYWWSQLWGRSIRTDLIVSQLLLLTLLVLAYGGSIYLLVTRGTHRQVEADLLGAAQLLAQDLQVHEQPSSLEIARAYRHRFGPAPRDHAYFAVWDREGVLIGGSDPLPPHAVPSRRLPPLDGPRPFVSRMHGPHMEVIVRGPRDEQILVGRPMAKENDGLRSLLVAVTTFGVLSLAVGVAGAWWLARRICLPLERITTTAEQISFRRLDQRLTNTTGSGEVGRLTRVINTMLDRLQGSFQQQVRFTADASHELRTPVAVILTQAEHTLSRPRTSEDYCAALQTCVVAAGRMKQLIDDLLLLARADMGRLNLRQIPLDLTEITREVLTLLEPLAEERAIQLTSQLLPSGVVGDPLRLSQVVTNLVTNAIRYNRPKGSVSVSVYSKEETTWLVVSDSGIGISEEDREHVLERFFRSDRARTFDANQGTGLGLSITNEIITAHGGTMEILSQPDRGTKVTVQLPGAKSLA